MLNGSRRKKLITILAGGSGSVKMVRGFASQRTDINVVTNVGDNYWLYGMYICPDIDMSCSHPVYKAVATQIHKMVHIVCVLGVVIVTCVLL